MFWKIISDETNLNDSQFDATDICDKKIFKNKSNFCNNIPPHTLHIKRQKISVDYKKKLINDFGLVNVDEWH